MARVQAPKGTRIIKVGTRAGQPHYGVDCLACPQTYGRVNVVRVAGCSADAAVATALAHLAEHALKDLYGQPL
jgi:hypothetical protein